VAAGRASGALFWLGLALALATAARGAELGTLFHSPEERERLNKLRRGEPVETAALARRGRSLTGYVQRSDGRNTVWIDGVAVPLSAPKGATLLDPRSVHASKGAEDSAQIEFKRR